MLAVALLAFGIAVSIRVMATLLEPAWKKDFTDRLITLEEYE